MFMSSIGRSRKGLANIKKDELAAYSLSKKFLRINLCLHGKKSTLMIELTDYISNIWSRQGPSYFVFQLYLMFFNVLGRFS